MAGKDISEHAGKAKELCFVVKCFILRQNIKFAYLAAVAWCEVRPHQGYKWPETEERAARK